jgi:hypothetical protein
MIGTGWPSPRLVYANGNMMRQMIDGEVHILIYINEWC